VTHLGGQEVRAVALTFLVLVTTAVWVARKGALLWVAGVDPAHIQAVPDRARYTSMGAIVVLTATVAAASMTTALTLVFSGHRWLTFLPVGLLWGAIVFSFDRWIVSSVDYGPLQDADQTTAARRSRFLSKVVQFLVRLTMAGLVGLIISEPIVLAVFGPEISQQLTAQHAADASLQAAQLNAEQQRQLAVLNGPVTSADTALASATAAANSAHKIYICELTGQCRGLPAGEVTGVAGYGPQTSQDYTAWQGALGQQQQAQRTANHAGTVERANAAALQAQTQARIQAAAKTAYSDNGLLAREKALDTLSQQNRGFLLRRIVLWLALMFIDLAPVILKTFSPRTLYEIHLRSEAIRAAHNLISEAQAEREHEISDARAGREHESAIKAIWRDSHLRYHRLLAWLVYSLRLQAAWPPGENGPGSRDSGRRSRAESPMAARQDNSAGDGRAGITPQPGHEQCTDACPQCGRPLAAAATSSGPQ
jgi:hypothetical protein